MNIKKLVVGVVVLGLVVFVGVKYPKSSQSLAVDEVVKQAVEKLKKLGASAGPDSFFTCETHNGVQTCFAKQSFKTSTSTPVDILSPSATSTLSYASCNYKGNAGGAVVLGIWKGATLNATTTVLARRDIAAPGSMNYPLVASTTPVSTAETTLMFPPSNHLVFELQGVVGVSLTGSCSAEWKTI